MTSDDEIMADHLLHGARMLARACPDCGCPLFEVKGETSCVVCAARRASAEPAPADGGPAEPTAGVGPAPAAIVPTPAPGPLADELGATLDAVDLGSRWRDELRALADRLDLPDLRRAVAAITRTETLGTSLAETTAELAVNVRASRRAAITERARTAPVKMLFPLVFLVLPAFLLLTVVPVLLTTVQSIS